MNNQPNTFTLEYKDLGNGKIYYMALKQLFPQSGFSPFRAIPLYTIPYKLSPDAKFIYCPINYFILLGKLCRHSYGWFKVLTDNGKVGWIENGFGIFFEEMKNYET